MDGLGSAGDTGFDAALRALDELESDVVRQQGEAAGAAGLAIVPTLAIDIDPGAGAIDIIDAAPAPIAPLPEPSTVATDSAAAPIPTDLPESEEAAAPTTALKKDRSQQLPMVAAGLGVFASLLSVIGLLVASRTVANASLVVADARERQQQMSQVGLVLRDLDKIRARQLQLLQRQEAAAITAPVTGEQLDRAIDSVRSDLGKHGPDSEVIRTIHDSQTDLNARLNEIGLKMERIEAGFSGARPSLPRG